MKKDDSITESEMIESLKRSGYLLESEILKILSEQGFFVETNQVIKDTVTSKSREIDILAEYYQYDEEKSNNKVSVKIKFVFEVKNNTFPVVLLTNLQKSPNIDTWEYYKVGRTGTYLSNLDFDTDFYSYLIDYTTLYNKTFTQYCSFQKKKQSEELMALHPEELYSGLLKITQYCEEKVANWNNYEVEGDDYSRNFLYLPVVLLKDDLFEFHIQDNDIPILKKVEESTLIFNYHYDELPQSAFIYFVTKKGLQSFLKRVLEIEQIVGKAMLSSKKK